MFNFVLYQDSLNKDSEGKEEKKDKTKFLDSVI